MSAPVRVRLEVPAEVKYLRVVTACVEQLLATTLPPTSPDLSHDLQLALQEACSNIIVHAYDGVPAGQISVEFELRPDTLSITLTDRGKAFDPDAVPMPDFDAGQVHGYGLFLVRSLLDDVTYAHSGGENRWELVKRLI